MGQRRPGRATHLVAGALLAAGALAAGCSSGPGGGVGVTSPSAARAPSPSVSWTGARVAAGTFPTLPGYTWAPVPDAEWAKTWTALGSSYRRFLADGQAKYVRDAHDHPVGMVVVAWPPPGKGGAAAMKAALDQQGRQAAQHDGSAGVQDVAGHAVLEFKDAAQQPNWYWVSGDEMVMVTGRDDHRGADFVAAFSAATR